MVEEENIINYKVVQQIDIYKNTSFSNTKYINEDKYIENKISNEIAYTNALSLLSDNHEYKVIFPKQTTYYEYFNKNKVTVEDMRKIKIALKSIQKILKLANIGDSEIFMYILFYHIIINLETSTENMVIYNLNYDNLMDIIKCFHIKYKDDEFQINKNSLKKIIEMCGITYDERYRYLNFYEVEEKTIRKYNNTDLNKNTSKINSISDENNKYLEANTINKEENVENNKEKKEPKLKSKSKTKKKSISKNKDKIKNSSKNKIKNNSKIKTKVSKKENKIPVPNKSNKRNNNINNINTLKYNIYNTKLKNFNLLDSFDDDDNEIFERSYDYLNTPRLKNKYNENKENDFFNNIENINNNKNLNNEPKMEELSEGNIIKKSPKKKKRHTSKKRKISNYEINHENSVTYLRTSNSPLKISNEIQTQNELIYPFNGYTKFTTSFAIETQDRPKILISKKDDDYCYYPFILRKVPELRDKTIYLCGSLPKLGSWDPLRAIKMDEENRNGEEFFSKYIEVHKNEIPFEYKYFYYDNNGKINWIGLPYENFLTFPQFFESLRSLKKSHISIIDLNIRYINNIDGINIWDNRKKALIELLLNRKADIFLFQEITRPQSDFIDKYLGSIYEFVGEYRDSSDKSEKCSICVNKLKYTIIHSGQFWLSSTPYIPGSNDFGNFFPRICTWASLKQIEGITLLFMNVHLDHVNKRAHLPCLKVVIEEEKKIEKRFKDIHFVFIAGCFYCEENDEEIKYIKNEGYTEIIFGNSYHGFTGVANNHWDYMFWKEKNGDDIEFKKAYVMKKEGTIDESRNHYISDHFPIYAEFFHKNIQ